MSKEDASPNHLLFLPCMCFTIALGQAACCGCIQLLLANPRTLVGAILFVYLELTVSVFCIELNFFSDMEWLQCCW